MLVLAYTFLLFAYWTLLGRAIIAVVFPRLGVLRAFLLAPATGLSASALSIMVLNQAGIPIRTFALPLTLGLAVAAAITLGIIRPRFAVRASAPFVLAAILALGWAGWPAVELGFNWVSYGNDDMANYCLAAQRFLDHGFYDVPTLDDLWGRDYATHFFFMHVADMMRFGAEHTVAWTAGLARLKATEAFMPAIMALGLVQLFAGCGLALHRGRDRRLAVVTAFLLAFSPLFMLGMLYQLIAQVGGVALLLSVIALLVRGWITVRRRSVIRYAVLAGIHAAALCVFYPEVSPFAALTVLTYAFVWTIRHRVLPRGLLAVVAYTILCALVILRHNFVGYVVVFFFQAAGAFDKANLLLSLFPFFMVPTGFSNLYGWMPLGHDFPEPAVSVSIAAGILLTLVLLGRALRDAWRLVPAAVLLLIQFAVAVRLFVSVNDFGVYKLSMWMQPAICILLAALILALQRTPAATRGRGRERAGALSPGSRGRRALAVMVFAVLFLSTAPTGLYYTLESRGLEAGGMTELRLASRLGIAIDAPKDKALQLIGPFENVVAAKFAATETRGHYLALLSRDFWDPVTRIDYANPMWPLRLNPNLENMAQAVPLIAERNRETIRKGELWHAHFRQPVLKAPADGYLVLDPQLSLFNKLNQPEGGTGARSVFSIAAPDEVRNHVVFVHSSRGNHYYLGDRQRISAFQQERDLSRPGAHFNAIGRFMLLRIENPSPRIYLRFAATRSYVTGRTNWSPEAVVHGVQDLPLGAVGEGAFNLFVGPLEPVAYQGGYYVAIDLAEEPRQILDYRPGLKRLYNLKVPMDYRRIVGWARDVSAVSEVEYESMTRPRSVTRFPDDLAQASTLEFAGIFEDGWMSRHARMKLGHARPGGVLRLRGYVPEVAGTPSGTARLEAHINGRKAGELDLRLGAFDWLLPIPEAGDTTDVELLSTAAVVLPGHDQRPIVAKLDAISIEDPAATYAYTFPLQTDPAFAATGLDRDGWAGNNVTLSLPAAGESRLLELELEYPTWGDASPAALAWRVAGQEGTLPLVPGERPHLRIKLPAAADPSTLQLTTEARVTLPAPDGRQRAFRIAAVRLVRATS